jgi:mannose-6-phosphate isomerase-like protein (cupin superfamily)
MVQKIDDPAPILADGSKIIEEYVGRVRTDTEGYSVAHMIAPPGWTEPFQRPDFDEVTIVVGGRIQIEHDDRKEVVAAGEVVLVGAGERIRYANPFEESAEYWAVCIPAFDPATVRRES